MIENVVVFSPLFRERFADGLRRLGRPQTPFFCALRAGGNDQWSHSKCCGLLTAVQREVVNENVLVFSLLFRERN